MRAFPALVLACLGAAWSASPVRATVFGDVNVTISSAALSAPSTVLWEFEFGIAPGLGATSTASGVIVKTGPNVSWGSPSETVLDTVNGFFSANSTVSIGNFSQFVAKSGSTVGHDYNKVLFSNLVSPSADPIIFTFFDPPASAMQDAPLTIRIHGVNNAPDLLDMSFVYRTDGTFVPVSFTPAQGVSVVSEIVPEPSGIALLLVGLVVLSRIIRNRTPSKASIFNPTCALGGHTNVLQTTAKENTR